MIHPNFFKIQKAKFKIIDFMETHDMTNKELLIPRYEVIAEDTSNRLDVGKIYESNNNGIICVQFNCEEHFIDASKYPHLFRRMKWYENRKKNDLPEYVKEKDGTIWKVLNYADYDIVEIMRKDGSVYPVHLNNFHSPATKSEYEQQNTRYNEDTSSKNRRTQKESSTDNILKSN